MIRIGFSLMAAGLVFGALHGKATADQYWEWSVRNTLGVLVCAVFGVLLLMRATTGWRGKKASILTLVGVSTTLVIFVAISF